MREPAEIVEDLERHPELPTGSEERVFGYGVMGLPFRSGHVDVGRLILHRVRALNSASLALLVMTD